MDYDTDLDEFDEDNSKTVDPNITCDISFVKDYNFTNLPENFAVLISSPRRAGKSHLMKFLLMFVKDRFDKCYCFSESCDLQNDIYDYVPEGNRFNTFDEDVLRGIIKFQEDNKKTNNKLKEKDRNYSKVLIILDDIIGDPKVRKSRLLNNIFSRGRHSNLSVIILSQTNSTRHGFPRVILENTDIAISFLNHNQFSRETFVEYFMSVENKKNGMILYNSICKSSPYTAVVCDKSISNIQSYKDYVFKIKAPAKLKNYKIGKTDYYTKNSKAESLYSIPGYIQQQGFSLNTPAAKKKIKF